MPAWIIDLFPQARGAAIVAAVLWVLCSLCKYAIANPVGCATFIAVLGSEKRRSAALEAMRLLKAGEGAGPSDPAPDPPAVEGDRSPP